MEEPAAGCGGYDAPLTTPPPPSACAICMEPWACSGGHRICCIPCGHVYGRSCLETWLHRSGPDTAKCPQCGENFEQKLIINLYAPGNLWDGCCRFQELKERSVSILRNYKAESLADYEKLKAVLKEQSEVVRDKMAEMESLTDGMQGAWNKKMSILHANLTSMKEQMTEMSREENTTAADVVEFMERSLPELSEISYPSFSSASAPAPPPTVDPENAEGHLNDLVPKPMAAPPGRADHVKRKRRRGT